MANKRLLTGPDHPLYREGKSHDANGYVTLTSKEHGPDAGRREHRVVMERAVGRPLETYEVVHHINHNPADNRLENLRLETRQSHPRAHLGRGAELTCMTCGAGRWYSASLIALMRNPEKYKCRMCRFGKTWNNGGKVS